MASSAPTNPRPPACCWLCVTRAWPAENWCRLQPFFGTVAGLRFISADLGLFVFQYGLDLLDLDTKWAALMSYGLTVKLLQDVLPSDEPLEALTIRNHMRTVAQRLEEALGSWFRLLVWLGPAWQHL